MKVEIELYTENDKLRVIQQNKIKKSKNKKTRQLGHPKFTECTVTALQFTSMSLYLNS